MILAFIALTLLLAGCGGGGGGGSPDIGGGGNQIAEPMVVATLLEVAGAKDPVTVSLFIPTDQQAEVTTTVRIPILGGAGGTLTIGVIVRQPSSPAHSVTARVVIPPTAAGGRALIASITLAPLGAGQMTLSGAAPIPPIMVAAVLAPGSGDAAPVTVSLSIPLDSRIEPLTMAVQIPPSGRLSAALMATVIIMPPDSAEEPVTARIVIPSGGDAAAITSTLVIPAGDNPAISATILVIPPPTADGRALTASVWFSPLASGRITLTIAVAEPIAPVMVAAVLAPGNGNAELVTVSLTIPLDPYAQPLTMAMQIPPSGRLLAAFMATVIIMPPDSAAGPVTARIAIPSADGATAVTSTLVIPAGDSPAISATVLVIPPLTAGGQPLTASIMFSPLASGRITLTITAPSLPRRAAATVHAYAQDLPQTYFYASLTVDTASLTVSLYTKQLQYGITLVGAHRLHWSRLKPLGFIAGEPPVSERYIRGAGVTVGIVDSGIDTTHPDLRDNVLTITGHGVRMENIEDGHGHGTWVAGIIAASLNQDGSGVVGVAPEAKLLAVHYVESPEETQVNLATAYNYMAANNAFVVNNSWGRPPVWYRITVGASVLYDPGLDRSFLSVVGHLPAGRYWIEVPWRYAHYPASFSALRSINLERAGRSYQRLLTAANSETGDNMLIVFAAGNTGWNSETGKVNYCSADDRNDCPFTREIRLPDSADIASLTVYAAAFRLGAGFIALTFPGDGNQTIAWDKNYRDSVADIPSDNPDAAQNWLNVVNIDRNRRIYHGSNGCGVTHKRCLAAPGVRIITTRRGGRFSRVTGTSFAAPHVSGAAALLKGAFPNLTPQQVANILLESADGKNDCAKDKMPKTKSCSEPVYGHGILNITAAFTPASFISFAAEPGAPDSSRGDSGSGAAVRGGFDIAASRIRLSPAFGAAPWRRESLAIGGLDNYGRVFYTQLDLSGGVYVSKPLVGEDREVKGAAIHRAYAPPLSRPPPAATYIAADELASAQWRQSAAGISYGGAQSPTHQSHFISSHLGSSRLGWHTRSGHNGLVSSSASYWQAPFDSGGVHQLQWDYPLAAPAAQVGFMLGGGDGSRQTAARLQWQTADWALSAEGGVVRENSQVLGASFTGGFSLQGAETRYRRLRGVYQPADGLRLFADYVQSDSEADGGGGIVRRLEARADAWQAGLDYRHWRFVVSQPLAVTSGGLDLSYISGYTAAGDYAVTRKRLDLSSGQRSRRVSLLYEREAIDGLSVVLGLDVWRQAPARGYAGDLITVSGAMRYRF